MHPCKKCTCACVRARAQMFVRYAPCMWSGGCVTCLSLCWFVWKDAFVRECNWRKCCQKGKHDSDLYKGAGLERRFSKSKHDNAYDRKGKDGYRKGSMLSALVPMRACVSVCVRAYAIMYVCFCEAIYNCNDAIFKLCCTERETWECGSGLVNKYCF